mgnify:CR=1 FL=1
MKPLISICIPCWNQAKYLPEAIESVLAQTVKPYEIIVISDGSPDETRYVARSYDVKYIETTNRGLASARNTGIMNMTGDYFYPLDADDKMLPNCIERVSQVIEGTDADIVAPSFRCFGVNNDEVILTPNPTIEDFKVANRIGYFSAIKKEALLEVGGYSTRMIWGYEDYHLWFNLLRAGKNLVTIPDILIMYRTKEQSMIHDAQKHHSELMTQIYKDFNFE